MSSFSTARTARGRLETSPSPCKLAKARPRPATKTKFHNYPTLIPRYSIVENNVAIIVGSLPAFANFLRIYVHDTALVRSLRSKLSSRSGDSKGSTRRSSGGGEKLKRWTVGSSQPRARRDRFQDLDESAIILKSNDSISEDAPTSPRHSPSNSLSSPPLQQVGDRDILRTVEFTRTEMNSPPPPARMV